MEYRYEIKVPISQYNEFSFFKWFLSLRNIRTHNVSREINNIYFDTLEKYISLGIGNFSLKFSVIHWINDVLMTVFFFREVFPH